jgi:hypothetical protein
MIDIPGKKLKKIAFDNPLDDLPSKKNRIIRVEYNGWTFFNDPLTTITISIPNEDPTFIFPLQENTEANLEIDWGDRMRQAVTTTTAAGNYDGIPHTYAIGGIKKIQVRGTAIRLTANKSTLGILFSNGTTGFNAAANKNKVIAVNHLNDIIDEKMITTGNSFLEEAFYNCSNLIMAPAIPQSITTVGYNFLRNAFFHCSSLVHPPVLPPNITRFQGYFLEWAFSGCTSLSEIPDIQFPNLDPYYDNHGLLRYAFGNCTSLTSIPDSLLNGLSVDKSGEILQSAFAGCTSLTSLPGNLLSQVPVLLPYSLRDTFRNCTNLRGNTPVDGSGRKFWERYSGDDVGLGCFANCTRLSDYASIPEYWKQA